RSAAIGLTSRIGSDHYRAEALRTFLAADPIPEGELREVIAAVRGIGSDHYKAGVLVEIAGRHTLAGATRELFLDAVQSIDSSHYRGEVADVLLRQGRGGG